MRSYRKWHFYHGLFFVLFALIASTAQAQLNADFTADVTSGCSPLTVSFTNKTTGAPAGTTYLWELGNGNTSDDTDVKAVYTAARTYTIKLTAKNGAQTHSKTLTVTVYRNPVPDFTASPLKGCAPADILFTSKSQPGDGTITNYFWDFGDGSTENNITRDTITHKYTFAIQPPVKLTVTNSHGCFATAEKTGLINILRPIDIKFAASQTTLCAVPGAVTFSNSTTGPGTLSYAWDFGNGASANAHTPAQVNYTEKGLYTVKLTVTSSEGCVDSLVKKEYINAANFNTQFELPAPLCNRVPLNFVSTSRPLPEQSRWQFGDGNTASSGRITHSYRDAGTYTVKLINTYGACTDTLSRELNINGGPEIDGFLMDKTGACTAPLTVNFEDSSNQGVRWHWQFGTGAAADTANSQKASFTYTRLGNYFPALTVTNALGCPTTIRQAVSIQRPNINISIKQSTSEYNNAGCPGTKVQFSAFPTGNLTSYRWDFGDGGSSTDAEPEHVFDKEGFHTVKLYYKTAAGCEDSATAFNMIRIYQKPKADFTSASGLTICGNTPVAFKDLTDTATRWNWDFGDGGKSTLKNPIYSYSRAGEFTVTLIATNQYCADTLERPQFIKLVPPFPDITHYENNCTNRGAFTFHQTTEGATSWAWDFGDGSPRVSYTTNVPKVTHQYTRSGVFRVVLYASDNTCTTIDTIHVSVMLRQQPVLTIDKNALCGSDTLTYTVSGVDTIRYYNFSSRQTETYPYYSHVQYSNGRQHSGTGGWWYPPQYSQAITGFPPGTDSIRLITYNTRNGCSDTSNFVTLQVSGPVAGFGLGSQTFCAGAEVTFTDTSKSTGGVPIKQWIWDFGDNNRDTLTAGAPFRYTYHQTGNFYPRLKVVDQNGCFAETAGGVRMATIHGPVANFYTAETLVSPNTPIKFINTTDLWPYYPTTYTWDFGDGSATSTQEHPVHTYTRSGRYTVRLIARSSRGCVDTLVRQAYVDVKTVRALFTFTASYVNNNNCPPLQARFRSNSVNADSLFWDFGNSGNAVNRTNPQATYYQPGVYKVTLYAYGQGSVDSVTQELTVNGPYGTVTPSALMGCSPTEITLTGKVTNATRLTWDFNDGFVAQGTDTAASHRYTKPGVYHPKVVLRDSAGCTSTILLQDSIIIDRLRPSIAPSPTLVCDSAMVTFATRHESFAADSLKVPLQHHWSFGTGNAGDTSNIKEPQYHYNVLGTYVVSLQTASPYGCAQTTIDTIFVKPKPKAAINAVQSVCVQQQFRVVDTAASTQGDVWNWRFGDGRSSAQERPDPLRFNQPGTYAVSLIKTSANGCSDTATHPVLADKLEARMNLSNRLLCDSGLVQFKPEIRSYAADSLGASLQYVWRSGHAESSTDAATSFAYRGRGVYRASLTVKSPYGCEATSRDSVQVLRTPKSSIVSFAPICAGGSMRFAGQISEMENTTWNWDLAGVPSSQQEPPVQTYRVAGTYPIRLIAFNHPACPDTASASLVVNPLPQIGLSPRDTTICRGDSITLQAHDAVQYTWTLNNETKVGEQAGLRVSPPFDARYRVAAVNRFGCTASDSLRIRVSQPFTIKASADRATICANWTVGLQVSGAARYQWTPADVSNPQSPTPVAKPGTTTTYMVVGYGTDHCFTDTATVHVRVIPLPQLRVSNDTTVMWGAQVPLRATTSADVNQLLWTPANYLNCTTCNEPVSTPMKPVAYRVIAKNSFGCIAVDTVRINLACTASTVHIPNAFTPDADGLNDVFYVKGGGVQVIKFFRIFNRWGDLVFEKTNIAIDDRKSAWDGTFQGRPLPPENYVYITEMVCPEGKVFQIKGMVTLIR